MAAVERSIVLRIASVRACVYQMYQHRKSCKALVVLQLALARVFAASGVLYMAGDSLTYKCECDRLRAPHCASVAKTISIPRLMEV